MIPVQRRSEPIIRRRKKRHVDYRDKVIVAQWMIIAAFAVLTYILQVGPV